MRLRACVVQVFKSKKQGKGFEEGRVTKKRRVKKSLKSRGSFILFKAKGAMFFFGVELVGVTPFSERGSSCFFLVSKAVVVVNNNKVANSSERGGGRLLVLNLLACRKLVKEATGSGKISAAK